MKYILLIIISIILGCTQPKESEIAFSIDKYQPVGVAISKNNRTFVSFPNWLTEYRYAVVEMFPDGSYKPYPNAEQNNWMQNKNSMEQFISVQNIVADTQNNLWILDPANPQLGETIENGVKLIKIDLLTDSIRQIYYFPDDLVGRNSFLNDVQIDEKHNMAYMSDPNQKALILLNLETGEVKRVLQDNPALVADPNFVMKIDGNEIRDADGNLFNSNVNGIGVSRDFEWFYFRPETDVKLYRIGTKYLADFSLNNEDLSSHIEDLGLVGQSNGIAVDSQGNIYLSAAVDKAIKRIKPNGEIEVLVQGDEYQWPDTFALGPNEEYILVTISQINKMSWFNGGHDLIDRPFRIIKIKL